MRKRVIPYEQAHHAFLSLTADAYGKISDDFVRFLWMMANTASTNSRLSQPSPNSEPPLSQDSFTKLRSSFFSQLPGQQLVPRRPEQRLVPARAAGATFCSRTRRAWAASTLAS
jgi:hypothetical protein